MKIIFIGLSMICFFSACKQKRPLEYGTLSGNIYWKYNNFIGNRPDAGSSIDIYSLSDSTFHLETTADVRGDYRFDSIPTGSYVAIIQSKSTTKSAKDNLRELYLSSTFLEKAFHVEYEKTFESDYYKKIAFYDSLSSAAINYKYNEALPASRSYKELNSALKYYELYKDSSNKVADSIIDLLPTKIKIYTGVYGNGSNSVKIEHFTIDKNRTTSLVTDFGITYF